VTQFVSRKLPQDENLDVQTLKSLLNDTDLFHSALRKAAGERIKIIMTLKTIERQNREGAHFRGAGLSFISVMEGPRVTSGVDPSSPHAHILLT